MIVSPRRWLVLSGFTLMLGLMPGASCLIYNEDLLESGSGGNGGVVTTGGATGGGGQVMCTTPDECPGMDTQCGTRTCPDGVCGMTFVDAGAACSESGGQVCDGMGSCVECTTPAHCNSGEVCSNNTCVDEGSLMLGDPCSVPTACASNQCVDGVCCADACIGSCRACDVSGSAGTCSNIPDGQDPDTECGADACNGNGLCRCMDGVVSGNESDVDCGGSACGGCDFGEDCNGAGDCLSNSCVGNTCSPLCGDTMTQGSEECDDGNTDSFDGCSALCLNPTSHLLLSEFAVTPTAGEFIEIYNPTGGTIALSDVYLADYNSYYAITTGGGPPGADFLVRFPNGTTIPAGGFVVLALDTAANFTTEWGVAPDYDLAAMVGQTNGTSGLTNGDEMIVMFQWNGVASTVTDIDYVVYGNTSDAMDKTGVSGYQSETPVANQVAASAPGAGQSLHRCDTAESTETKSGGNGQGTHDETSEDGQAAWKLEPAPSPGAAPAAGLCP